MGIALTVPYPRNPDGRFRSWWRLPVFSEIKALAAQGLEPFGFVLYNATIASQVVDRASCAAFPANSWLWGFTASSTGLYALELYDAGYGELLQIAPVNGANRCGTGKFPYYLKHAYKLVPTSQIVAKVTNLTTANNAIQVVGWGMRP